MFLRTRTINCISAVLAIAIITVFCLKFYTPIVKSKNEKIILDSEKIEYSNIDSRSDLLSNLKKQNDILKKNIDYDEIHNKKWTLKIEKIDLNASISDGTDKKNLNKYIGHFKETVRSNGNIGLAAHNRGYRVNYFKNIKNLKKGDIIKYFYNGNKYIYKAYTNYIILDTDWTVLENNKNEITLITCVENEPTHRRCVKGKLIYINNERIEQ